MVCAVAADAAHANVADDGDGDDDVAVDYYSHEIRRVAWNCVVNKAKYAADAEILFDKWEKIATKTDYYYGKILFHIIPWNTFPMNQT